MPITVETTQNVAIEYDIASLGDRIFATFIDYVIIVAYALLLLIALNALDLVGSIGSAAFTLLFLPVFLYDLLCEVFLSGQSFGKMALRIKVVKIDGSEPTLGSYVMRWLLRIVDSFPPPTFMVGLLVVGIGGKGQRLGDLAAGTTVIKVRPRVSLSDVLMPVTDATYVPVYPEVTKLSDHDIAILRDVWTASRTQESRATITALAARVAAVMGIDDVLLSPQYPGPDKFLETVVRDYAFYTSGDEA